MCTKASPSSPTGMGQFLKALRLLQVGRRLTFEYIARLVEIDVHLNTLHLHECKIFHSPLSNYRTAHISCRVPENRLSGHTLFFVYFFIFLFFVLSFCSFLFVCFCFLFLSVKGRMTNAAFATALSAVCLKHRLFDTLCIEVSSVAEKIYTIIWYHFTLRHGDFTLHWGEVLEKIYKII